jgi:hypothetical protein
MSIFWIIVLGVLFVGLAGWGWSHYRKQTIDALDKVGDVVDTAVNKAEDAAKK